MDAVKYLKEMHRMCNGANCCECPLYANNNGKNVNCKILEREHAKEAVSIVEKWSAENPAKTRQSEFLKMFPNAKLDYNGIIMICPVKIEQHKEAEFCPGTFCTDCRKNYWLEEVE